MTHASQRRTSVFNRPLAILGAVRRRAERGVAPLLQRRATAAYQADRQGWLRKADIAVQRGLDWFAPQPDLTMSALYVLWQGWRRGTDARFAMIHPKIAHYRATLRDPALRLFDPGYDPDAAEVVLLPDIMQVRPYLPIELLMIEAVWADKRDPGPDFLQRLAAIDDRGWYGTTHIVVAAELMLRSGAYSQSALLSLMQATVAPMDLANRRATLMGDIFAERALMLYWLNQGHLVTPGQVVMMLNRQRADGGWSAPGVAPDGLSNQHTTSLAVAVIAEFLAQERGR
ncbi:hypothetical protein [Rhodobacter ferrooxidans]|uniref:Uncharacterized protein n=1 Tax=Rhodobacter ferrooxidans TaxID=371731 RepID=C8S4A3_9RHOB|nr:hypothetical protein [Rhodobacter sp. SW2]EEW24162.1 hypothetical protein Rsw2DRAFT_2881 [Rhodobacter sp. SW2]